MGAVFRPKDLLSGRRRVVDEAVRDLSPTAKDDVVRILRSWEGAKSRDELREILGEAATKRLLKKIKANK